MVVTFSKYHGVWLACDLITNAVEVTSNGRYIYSNWQYIVIGRTTRGSGLPFGGGVSSDGYLNVYVTKLIYTSDGHHKL